jgi:NAD(P)H-flavin reductase
MQLGQRTDHKSVLPSENPWLPQTVRIQDIKQEVPDTATYKLVFDDPHAAESYSFAPGQFNMLYLPGFGEAAISISSDPERRESLWHTVRLAGNVTQALDRKQPGDQIALRGPFGSAWPIDQCRGRDVVIAGGGIGLAPLRPLLYHIINHRQDFRRVILLYGARAPQDLLYTDEFDSWRNADLEIEVTVDRGETDWQGHIGVVPALFYRLRLDAAQTRVLTCGPEIMMRFVVFEALARRIRPRDIYISMERNMQCAVGFCGHCQLGPAFVCKDGPVFSYDQIEPFLRLDDL